jgi:hypothetical protein
MSRRTKSVPARRADTREPAPAPASIALAPEIDAGPGDALARIDRMLGETKVALKDLAQEEGRPLGYYHRIRLTGSLSVPDSNGVRHRERLESFKDGGTYWTTREAYRRFLARLNLPGTIPPGASAPPGGRTARARAKAIAEANAACERLGS